MPYGFGSGGARREGGGRTLAEALRSAGRLALWAAVGLLLVRGTAAVLVPRSSDEPTAARPAEFDPATAAFAVRFARAYLEDPAPAGLRPFLTAGARIAAGRPASSRRAEVAQAEAIDFTRLGGGREVVTVACQLRDSRTLNLAVPIVRRGAGEAAALGAPSIVAVPAVAGADPERPRPPAGPGGAEITELVRRFLPAYLAAGEESELRYYLAPGASVVPLGGALRLVGISGVSQLGAGEGSARAILAAARVRDPASGATYPVAYRLEVRERGGRWYVSAVEGAVA